MLKEGVAGQKKPKTCQRSLWKTSGMYWMYDADGLFSKGCKTSARRKQEKCNIVKTQWGEIFQDVLFEFYLVAKL